VVNANEYMQPTMQALEEQNMHDTSKFSMSAGDYQKKMKDEGLVVNPAQPDEPQQPKQALVQQKIAEAPQNKTSAAEVKLTLS